MVIERTDLLIERVRRYTATQSYSDAAAIASQIGIQTQTYVDLFNEAQHILHGIIYAHAPALFVKATTQDITASTESYDLPSDAFLGTNIISVEYKYDSSNTEYYTLKKSDVWSRVSSTTGTPFQYIQHNDAIWINPIPSESITNGLRITYEYQVPELDIRRAKISSFNSATNPTSITVTAHTQLDVALDADAAPEYITVVDKDGTIKMDNIYVSAYDSSTGVITCSVSADATESIAANDYIVIGDRATTHSQFPEFCESWLCEYVKHAVFGLLGHPELINTERKLAMLQSQLIDVFTNYNIDIMYIPEHDPTRIIDI